MGVVIIGMSSPQFKPFPDSWDWDSIVEHIIVHYRFIFVMFLLPVSFLYDIWFYTRNKIVFAMSSAPTKHKEKVLGIQRQVNSCNISTSRTETKIFEKTLKTYTLKKKTK